MFSSEKEKNEKKKLRKSDVVQILVGRNIQASQTTSRLELVDEKPIRDELTEERTEVVEFISQMQDSIQEYLKVESDLFYTQRALLGMFASALIGITSLFSGIEHSGNLAMASALVFLICMSVAYFVEESNSKGFFGDGLELIEKKEEELTKNLVTLGYPQSLVKDNLRTIVTAVSEWKNQTEIDMDAQALRLQSGLADNVQGDTSLVENDTHRQNLTDSGTE